MIIFGVSEFAEVAAFYFGSVSAFTVDAEYIRQPVFCGKPVIPFHEIHEVCPPETDEVFVAIGYTNMNAARTEKCRLVADKGYGLASYVSPRCTLLSPVRGENCFVLEDNTIQPFVTIGNNVVLWSGNHVGHHAKIGDNCFITSHCVISGGVEIGANSFIGVNASIRDHVKVGARCSIGMGARVHKDVPDDGEVVR